MRARSSVFGIALAALVMLPAAPPGIPAGDASPPARADAAVPERPLRLVYFNDFYPYSYVCRHGEVRGLLVERAERVLVEELGLTVVHKAYPWARAQAQVQSGAADGFITVATDERRRYAEMGEEALITEEMAVFVREDHPSLEMIAGAAGLAELTELTFSTYTGDGWAERNLEERNLDVVWVATTEQALQMVSSGRVDAYVGVQCATLRMLEGLGIENLTAIEGIVQPVRLRLGISRESEYAAVVADFDAALRRLRSAGELDGAAMELCE